MKIIKIIRKLPLFSGTINYLEKKYCDLTYNYRELHKMPLKEESRGNDYPDITFFVIRRNTPNVGLFAYVISALGGIVYAIDKGYIPIVDMENYPNPYIDENREGGNSWEYYFEQPCGYCLQDIEHAKHVILSEGIPTWKFPDVQLLDKNNNEVVFWREAWKKYIRLNKQTYDYIFSVNKNICNTKCGVIIRGTDYTRNKPIGHPIQPTPEQAVTKVNELLAKWEYNSFFLTTEDAQVYNYFHTYACFKMISMNSFRLDEGDVTNSNIPEMISKTIGSYKHGLDYLTNVWIVSQCESIIAGKCGSTLAAKLMSDGYKNEYYWELGTYK